MATNSSGPKGLDKFKTTSNIETIETSYSIIKFSWPKKIHSIAAERVKEEVKEIMEKLSRNTFQITIGLNGKWRQLSFRA